MKIRKLSIILLALAFSSTALAQENASTATNGATQPKPSDIRYCPPLSALKHDPKKLNWTTKNGLWKSYSISFVKKVTKFSGAQWNGVRVGQITCVYEGAEKGLFPILLVFHALTDEPQQSKNSNWSKNLGGIRNCIAKNQQLCPFKMRMKKKQGNLIEEADQLKFKPKTAPAVPVD